MVKCRLFISKALSNEGVVILNQDIDKKKMENFKTTCDPKFLLCIVCKAKLSKGSKKSQLMKHLKTNKHLKAITSNGMTKNFQHL